MIPLAVTTLEAASPAAIMHQRQLLPQAQLALAQVLQVPITALGLCQIVALAGEPPEYAEFGQRALLTQIPALPPELEARPTKYSQ